MSIIFLVKILSHDKNNIYNEINLRAYDKDMKYTRKTLKIQFQIHCYRHRL